MTMRVKNGSLGQMALVETPGGPSVRAQIRAHERGHAEREQQKLAGAKTDQAKKALKSEFTAARAERARLYAAMITSADGWQPSAGARPEGKVLTSFYRLIGEKARELAAAEGQPLSLETFDRVRLTRADVEGLRKRFGDAEVKKALPLLKKHIIHERFLDKGALRFMASAQFLALQTLLQATEDRVERDIDRHREKLDVRAAEELRDHQRALGKRQLTHWDQQIVVECAGARAGDPAGKPETRTYAAVGGRLIPVDEKPE
jgi:hypothetical protein